MSARGAHSNRGGSSLRGGSSARGTPSARGGMSARGSRGGFANRGPIELFKPLEGPKEPCPKSEAKENSIMERLNKLPAERHLADFPPRRGFGTQGQKTFLRTNHFPLQLKSGIKYYQYEIDITPEVTKRNIKRRILDIYLEQEFPNTLKTIVTDGSNILLSAKELPLEEKGKSGKVNLWWPDDPRPKPDPNSKEYQVKIRSSAILELDKLARLMNSPPSNPDPENSDNKKVPSNILQALNVIVNQYSENDPETMTMGNKFFNMSKDKISADLGGGLEAIMGFYKTVRPATGRALCNVNVVVSAFYKSATLIDVAGQLFGRKITNSPLSDLERRRLNSFLRGTRVALVHCKARPIPVQHIVHQDATQHKFRYEEGGPEVTVQEFYQRKHKKTLDYPRLQLLKSREMMIPLEVCKIIPGQSFRGKANESQTSNMLRFACLETTDNAKMITDKGLKTLGLQKITRETTNYKFGIKVDAHMVVVPARILPSPAIQYQGSKPTTVQAGRGQWNLISQKFVRGCEIKRMVVIYFENTSDPNYNFKTVQRLVKQFHETALDVGIKIQPEKATKLKVVDVRGDITRQLTDIFKTHSDKQNRPTMMFVINPDEVKSHVFNDVKRFGDIKTGIPTVVVLFSKIFKGIDQQGNKQYLGNVLLKVNIRLGGINHTLQKEALKGLLPTFVKDGPAMLVGMDVTHPSPGMLNGSPSITSVVASNDSTFTNFPCSLRIQQRGEMIQNLREMFLERLREYQRVNPNANNGKPPKVIIYRDGVSEGEYESVIGQEFPQIIEACNDFEQGYKPPMTFIVVRKRHHTRFYPTDEKYADDKKRCLPGTVVDRGITLAHDFDFYLQPHKGLQGAAKPAHYFVLRDENGFTADSLQILTMNLCHLFPRATKTIGVCPPVKMADVACERGRVYLANLLDSSATETSEPSKNEEVFEKAVKTWGKGVHSNLRTTMFYL